MCSSRKKREKKSRERETEFVFCNGRSFSCCVMWWSYVLANDIGYIILYYRGRESRAISNNKSNTILKVYIRKQQFPRRTWLLFFQSVYQGIRRL